MLCPLVVQIYITEEIDQELAVRLKDIVKRHQGACVDAEDDATHIIYAVPESAKDDVNRKNLYVYVSLTKQPNLQCSFSHLIFIAFRV